MQQCPKNKQIKLEEKNGSGLVETKGAVSNYISAATSDNTRTAYQSDLRHFENTDGILPATPEMIEAYLIQCVEVHNLNPRTLLRRLTAIRLKLAAHE